MHGVGAARIVSLNRQTFIIVLRTQHKLKFYGDLRPHQVTANGISEVI